MGESDVKYLLYLQATVKKTMCLYPAAPLAALHENLKMLQKDPLMLEDLDEF